MILKTSSLYCRTLFIASILLLPILLFASPSQKQCDALISKGIDAMWQKDHVRSLELLTRARDMAEANRWYKQQFLAINNIGANYYVMLDYGEALNYYLESYMLAVKRLKPINEMVVLNNIAILYSKEKNFAKAREYFLKAYVIAKENNDGLKTGLYALNLGNLENECGNLKKAREYINESLPLVKGNHDYYLLAQTGLADNDLLLGDAALALKRASALYKNVTDPGYNEIGASLLTVMIKAHRKLKNYPEAIAASQKLLNSKPNLETRQTALELLSSIYANAGNYTAALRYKDSVLAVDQRLDDVKNGRLYESSKVKFEMQNYRNRLAINEQKMAAEHRLFYFIMAGALAVIVIVILVFRNISVRHKQRKLIAERHQQEAILALEKEKNEHLLLEQQVRENETVMLKEQEKLKDEIEARNRKLSARALYLSGRNQLIEEVIASLSQVAAPGTELAVPIKKLREHLKADEEWTTFTTHFEEVNQGMLNRLRAEHPALNANDLRFLSYVYMNLSTKEISHLLNITPEACRKRRERISTKMGLSADMSIFNYLTTLNS